MMIDTNVVIDLREEDARWHDWSLHVVALAFDKRPSVSSIVVSELASRSGTLVEITEMLVGYGFAIRPLDAESAYRAGLAQRAYRQAGGGRERLLADFLIGAQACAARQPLITRDARRYRTYFPELALITPETDNG